VGKSFKTHSQAKTHREACGGGYINTGFGKDIPTHTLNPKNTLIRNKLIMMAYFK
jgi:hypothetical protein